MELTPQIKAQLAEQKKQCIFCRLISGEIPGAKKVFEDDKVNFQWNGKTNGGAKCADGVYFYSIESPLPVAPKKGTISIIR